MSITDVGFISFADLFGVLKRYVLLNPQEVLLA